LEPKPEAIRRLLWAALLFLKLPGELRKRYFNGLFGAASEQVIELGIGPGGLKNAGIGYAKTKGIEGMKAGIKTRPQVGIEQQGAGGIAQAAQKNMVGRNGIPVGKLAHGRIDKADAAAIEKAVENGNAVFVAVSLFEAIATGHLAGAHGSALPIRSKVAGLLCLAGQHEQAGKSQQAYAVDEN
jgi:hypothetical protein